MIYSLSMVGVGSILMYIHSTLNEAKIHKTVNGNVKTSQILLESNAIVNVFDKS